MALLAINDLSVRFRADGREISAVRGVDIAVERGEIVVLTDWKRWQK